MLAGFLALTLLSMSCGSSPTTQSSPAASAAANQISGSASCSAAERQDLVFSGQVSGHVTCSTTAATCVHAWNASGAFPAGGVISPVSAMVGKTPVQLTVILSVTDYVPGTYVSGDPGEGSSATSAYGVGLDGIGSWVSAVGGSVVVSAIDSGSISGSVAVQMHFRLGGTGNISISGSWRCVKPVGF